MFEFVDPGPLVDEDLELALIERYPGNPETGLVPAYRFEMRLAATGERVGSIELRVGETGNLVKYAGHVGYEVSPEYRGHRYATRALRLLLPLARRHGLDPLWITCNPDNAASKRTCELAGAELVEVVDLPSATAAYRRGERRKCRYRLEP